MSKLMDDDNQMRPANALHHALFAKNVEPNNKGFSSFQIVYGTNPSIPGITNSTPPSLSTEFTSKDVREHLEKINKAREAFRVADNDERIKRALRSRIAKYNNEHFHSEDRVYFKENNKIQWSGPATVIGQQGKVVFLKYGNMLRRVHMSRIIRVGEEFKQNNEHTSEEIKKTEIATEKETVDNDLESVPGENEAQQLLPRPQRKASTKRPEKSRRILFKSLEDNVWKNALVTNVGNKNGTDQFKCSLLLDNSDELVVDFSEKRITWEYEKFSCDKCEKTFETKRSLKMHILRIHKENISLEKKKVLFKENEVVNFNDNAGTPPCKLCGQTFSKVEDFEYHIQTCHKEKGDKALRKLKVRFNEVIGERENNDKWMSMKNQEETEEVNYAEIKETEENSEKVREAKAKELTNFDEYKAFEEVEDKGQEVLGTRW